MDECLMLQWVDVILKPWAKEAPENIHPLIILDSYHCHMMHQVTTAINSCGVECFHIPGGCTSLCQPVDVGINKPFKVKMQQHWEAYLLQNRNVDVRGKIPSPTREVLSEWIIDSLGSLDVETVRNAWKCPGFSYFDPEHHPDGTHDEGNEILFGSNMEDDDVDGEDMFSTIVFHA